MAQITKLESAVALPEHGASIKENPKGNLGNSVVEWVKDNKTEIMIVTAGVAAAALILSTGGLGAAGVLGVLAVAKVCAIILGGTAIGVTFIAGASIGVPKALEMLQERSIREGFEEKGVENLSPKQIDALRSMSTENREYLLEKINQPGKLNYLINDLLFPLNQNGIILSDQEMRAFIDNMPQLHSQDKYSSLANTLIGLKDEGIEISPEERLSIIDMSPDQRTAFVKEKQEAKANAGLTPEEVNERRVEKMFKGIELTPSEWDHAIKMDTKELEYFFACKVLGKDVSAEAIRLQTVVTDEMLECVSIELLTNEIPESPIGFLRVPGNLGFSTQVENSRLTPSVVYSQIMEKKDDYAAKGLTTDAEDNDLYANDIGRALKQILRNTEFIPRENMQNILESAKGKVSEEKTLREALEDLTPDQAYDKVTENLSPAKKAALHRLLAKLSDLEFNQETTRMTADNIGTSIGPSLLIDSEDMSEADNLTQLHQVLCKKLIQWHRAQSN